MLATATMPPSVCPTISFGCQNTGSIVTRLNQEWEEMGHLPAMWMQPSPSLDDVLTSIRFDPDRVLTSLIEACQTGYSTAGRVIIQALLPKLILMSRAYPYPSVDHLVAAIWVRIGSYRLDRRPKSIAANLVLDAKKDVIGENRKPTVTPIAKPNQDLTAQAVIDTARTMQLATEETLTIVEHIYIDGLSSKRVGEIYRISANAVRRRCCDTIRRLKAHRHLLAELAAA